MRFVKKFRKASSEAESSSPTPTTSTASIEASGSSDVSTTGDSESTQLLDTMPNHPPPSYEHVLAESAMQEREMLEKEAMEEQKEENKQVIVVHKSTKKLYRALAAQWGITCRMSDHCPCLDCQGHYFDCEYDRDNEQEKTDGGLGAGTPMFISEVMHGSACSIL
ncbi:uncharacterized protein LOC106664660 isoform X2 [Cimex lectularius]|nr:uncharacterized protein LOC106664660 isoform X2 [Cimex lectularius]XP_024080491.1 uncharacterized protein LOC106664660 isoform X2 [Cimex lectularius]